MTKFLQIEEQAFNIDLIQAVTFYEVAGHRRVSLAMAGDEEDTPPLVLTGTGADMFLRWWNDHADVYKAP